MKLILAPMATLTHQPLRLCINQFGGCDEYFTEMIQAGTLITNGPFEKYYLFTAPEPEKIVWQLTGGKTDALEKACDQVCQIGGIGVDINMGCCAPDIVRSGAGIAWMLKPINETQDMLNRVGKIVNSQTTAKRFSVKMRLGEEDFTEDGFFSFVDMVVDQGVKQITLHPRTRKEKYRQEPRHVYVDKLCNYISKKNYDVDIILNGNIFDNASMNKYLKIAPEVKGVMIGRAAIQKPWIFAQLKGIAPESVDLLQVGLDFISYLEEFQPPEFYKTRLQRFFTYYADNVQFAHHLKMNLINNPTPNGCRQQLEQYFNQCPNERILLLK